MTSFLQRARFQLRPHSWALRVSAYMDVSLGRHSPGIQLPPSLGFSRRRGKMRPLCPIRGGQGGGPKLGPLPLSSLGGRSCRLEPGPSHLLRLAPHLSGPQVPVDITRPLIPTSCLRGRRSELTWERAGVQLRTHLHQLSWSWNKFPPERHTGS